MTDNHSDNHPADLDAVEAQAGQRSTKFRTMLIASTIIAIIAMIAVFLTVAA